MKRLSLLFILAISLLFTQCHKHIPVNSVHGTIVKKNVDGCTWLIQLSDHRLLEPTNLKNFPVTLQDGQGVEFIYTLNTNSASICMMGTLVDLSYIVDTK